LGWPVALVLLLKTNKLVRYNRREKGFAYTVYLKLTAACQTNANSKKKTGITGKMSTIGLKAE
jgi:hypothetical protein